MNKNYFLYRSSIVLLIGIICFFILTLSFETHQKKQELEHANYAMSYLSSLLSEKGDIKTINNKLYAGNESLHETNIVSMVKQITGFESTIFYKNIRISSTINSSENVINTEANKDISDLVLKNKSEFKGTINALDKKWLAYYAPLLNSKNETIGMLSVFKDYSVFSSGLFTFKLLVGLTALCIVLLRIYLIYKGLKTEKELDTIQKELDTSEINFKQIADTIDDVFYLFNVEENKYEFIGEHSLDILGFKPEELYQDISLVAKVIHPNDIAMVRQSSKDVLLTKQTQKIEYRIQVNDEIKWVSEQSYPIFDDNGVVIKVSGLISDATEHFNNEKQLIKLRENTKLLSEIGIEMGQHLNVEAIIKNMYSGINQIMDAEFLGIGLYNKKTNCLDFPYVIENDEEISASIPLDKNVLATICFHSNNHIHINDFEKEAQSYSEQPLANMVGAYSSSVLYVPIRDKNNVIGVITAQSTKKFVYSDTDVQFLKNLAIYASKSLINADLYESLEQKVEKRTEEVVKQKKALEIEIENSRVLAEMGTDLSSSLDFDVIFEKLHKNISKLMDAEMFGVRILDRTNHLIHYKYEMENGIREEVLTVSLDTKNNFTVWVVDHNMSIYINDNKNEYKYYVDEIHVPVGDMPNSLLFVPLVYQDEVIGVITVQSMKLFAYSTNQLKVLQTLAINTAIAIANADLYENLEDKVNERTLELNKANKEIVDSINYAKTIQESTLIKTHNREKLLKNSFVYYKPKHTVSGDFYRVDKLLNKNNETLIGFLVADCTGHGVPGATLAILCSNIMRQANSNPNIYTPGSALTFARQSLIDLFEHGKTNIYDGMDIGYGVLNTKTKILDYAGAINNCYIIRNGELIVIKGDRMHVGLSPIMNDFKTTQTQLITGDEVYIFSDGYTDQFGGEKHKKFTRKRFLKLLLSLTELPPPSKMSKLKEQFESWKGDSQQTDDVCVLGFTVE